MSVKSEFHCIAFHTFCLFDQMDNILVYVCLTTFIVKANLPLNTTGNDDCSVLDHSVRILKCSIKIYYDLPSCYAYRENV